MYMLQEAAGMLQAKQKYNHWCEIKPVQEKQVQYFFVCLKLQQKQNLFLKAFGEKDTGYNKAWQKSFI